MISKEEKKNYPFVYRIHEEPEQGKVNELKNYIKQFGYTINTEEGNLANSMNKLMKDIKGSPEEKSIEKFAIRSMSKAKYSTMKEKHFGLSFKHYTHFTSPIRRYPDLIAHRLIKSILNNSKLEVTKDKYEETLHDLSDLEKKAEIASRQVTQQMICFGLKKFIGEEFSTYIVGVTEFGLFCEIENFFISGLIHVSDLQKDRYIFDSQANILKGRRTGKIFRIGQKIKVQLVNVLPEERKITLVPK